MGRLKLVRSKPDADTGGRSAGSGRRTIKRPFEAHSLHQPKKWALAGPDELIARGWNGPKEASSGGLADRQTFDQSLLTKDAINQVFQGVERLGLWRDAVQTLRVPNAGGW